ncbi:hypothetical protein C4K19_2525 [Pseudomonas chlororaphis subsp. aurantiaca]|nr:hypothetical protein C4K19_2525 [Pseudomonas chlororaphis subsp. aurantiaca]
MQTKTFTGANQYFFYKFLRGIFFPINFFKAGPGSVHRFSRRPVGPRLKIFPAPTL